MYMKYEENLEQVGINQFKTDNFSHPDTYASKKRFLEKYAQLPVDPQLPITIIRGTKIYECCHGIKPTSYRERITNGGMRF